MASDIGKGPLEPARWVPTCELRFVLKTLVDLNMDVRPFKILQQRWIEVSGGNVNDWLTASIIAGQLVEPKHEWRDVPLVNEGEQSGSENRNR